MKNLKPIFDFANEIKTKLEREYPNAQITIDKVTKNNNVTAIGVCIRESERNISQMIYVNELYKEYVSRKLTLEDIVLRITKIHEETSGEKFSMKFDANKLLDKEYLRQNICLKLVNEEFNAEFLEDALYFPKFSDLAAMLYIVLSDETNGIASCKLKRGLFEIMDMSLEDLYELALKNTMEKFPAEFIDLMEYFHSEGGDVDEAPEGVGMWVLKNAAQVNGAVTVLYPDILKKLCAKYRLKTNLVLLPSSVHEWIIVEDDGTSYERLRDMVRNVNRTQVAEDEVLSNSIYLYSQEEDCVKKIKLAE